jgi:hypothetical protein
MSEREKEAAMASFVAFAESARWRAVEKIQAEPVRFVAIMFEPKQ